MIVQMIHRPPELSDLFIFTTAVQLCASTSCAVVYEWYLHICWLEPHGLSPNRFVSGRVSRDVDVLVARARHMAKLKR